MAVKVSIIVPVYNVEKYLRKCLDSLVNQTLKDIEIICINDGSTDDSLNVLQEYASGHLNVIVIDQENQGVSIARNNGINKAQGDYIGFVDPDDWVEPDMFKILYEKAVKTGVDIVECDYKMVFENSTKIKNRTLFGSLHTWKKFPIACGKIFDWKYVKTQVFNGLRCMVWNRLYKRSLIFDNNLTFPDGKCEDYPFSLDTVLSAKSIVYCPKTLYNYLIRFGSLSIREDTVQENKTKEDRIYRARVLRILKKHNLTKELLGLYDKTLSSYGKNSFFENIFSCKTSILNGKNLKRITILGITFHIGKK